MEDELEAFLRAIMRDRGRPDPLEKLIVAYFASDRPGRMTLPSATRSNQIAWRIADDLRIRVNELLSGAAGWDTLRRFDQALMRRASAIASQRSPAVWLSALRRLEDSVLDEVFSRWLSASLLEIMYSSVYLSTASAREREFERAATEPSDALVADIDDLLGVATTRRNVRSALLRVGKGQTVKFTREAYPFRVADDGGVEAAIELYDSRQALGGEANALGMSTGVVGETWNEHTAIAWVNIRTQQLVPERLREVLLQAFDPYFPVLADLTRHAPAVTRLPQAIRIESYIGKAALSVVWEYLSRLGATYRNSRGTWSRHGYILIPERRLSALWSSALEQIPVDELQGVGLAELTLPHRKVLLPVGRKYLVDLHAASVLFLDSVERAREGSAANTWGSSFEQSVQEVIDITSARPPERLRSLIGKTIRTGDRSAVTDVDAIAVIQDALVLIDAKSYSVGRAYYEGDYSAIRNIRERAERAAVSWRDKIQWISTNRSSLGVAIPDSMDIKGIVVTPFVPFLTASDATELVVGGLRAVTSLTELMTTLGPREDPDKQ